MATKGLEFDPGFAPYILAFRGTIEYLYADINRFKNLSQKKIKFKQYYKKILEMFYNNLGFYVGCLMWAAYIKTQPEQEILNNHCLGSEYNEEETISDMVFMIKFLELFPKDMKYFGVNAGANEVGTFPGRGRWAEPGWGGQKGINDGVNDGFEQSTDKSAVIARSESDEAIQNNQIFDPYCLKILELYKEFLTINKGFVDSKTNTDILLPEGMKVENAEGFKEKIEEVLKTRDLSKLLEYKDLVCQI